MMKTPPLGTCDGLKVRHTSHQSAYDDHHCMNWTAEGVAAPLEPTRLTINANADTLFAVFCGGQPKAVATSCANKIDWKAWQRVSDYVNQEAAAVSKNLQEELAQLKEDLRCETFNCECYEMKIEQLEKEITALRLELCDRDKQVKGLTEDAVRLIE